MEKQLIGFVRLIVTVVLLAVWAVVGFLLWVPFLVRAIGLYVGAVFASVISGRDLGRAQDALELATTFYVEGFRKMIESVPGYRRRQAESEIETQVFGWAWWLVISHTVFSIVFWLFVFGLVRSKTGWAPSMVEPVLDFLQRVWDGWLFAPAGSGDLP